MTRKKPDFHLSGLEDPAVRRRLGEALVEQFVNSYTERAPIPTVDADIAAIPEEGLGLSALPDIWAEIDAGSAKLGSPSMMGHMDTGAHPAAALTDAVLSALNNNLLFREISPFASAVEERLCADIAGRLGLSPNAAGTFASGGSIANLTALFAACGGFADVGGRSEVRLFVPECHHASVSKAASVLGLAHDQVIRVEGDDVGRADVDRLDGLLSAHGGRRNIVLGVLGSTVHGAVEPVAPLADVAERHGAWLHVDAVYGGALAFSHEHKHLLQGLARAHSVVIGPQKWMYAPRVSAIVYLKDGGEFDRRLGAQMPYSQSGGVNRGAWGLQGSRRADAVTLWVMLRVVGARRLGAEIDAGFSRARRLNALLRDHPAFAPSHEPDLNIQCFGFRDSARDDAQLRDLHERLTAAGGPWVSLSQWRGGLLLRAVLIHPETTESHFSTLLETLSKTA